MSLHRTRLPLLALAAVALALAACKETPSDKAFGAKVRAYLLAHPEVLRETAEALDKQDAAKAKQASLDAIRKNRKLLEHDPRDFVAHPDGKITVVQFFDYNCGYCKIVAPDVLKLINESPDVRFVFKELPVVGGPPSERAARIALAVQQQKGDYLGLYREFIGAKPLDDRTMDAILASLGFDPAALDAAAGRENIGAHVDETKKLASEIGLEGTPAFVVGDTMVGGAHIEELKAAIARAKKAT